MDDLLDDGNVKIKWSSWTMFDILRDFRPGDKTKLLPYTSLCFSVDEAFDEGREELLEWPPALMYCLTFDSMWL